MAHTLPIPKEFVGKYTYMGDQEIHSSSVFATLAGVAIAVRQMLIIVCCLHKLSRLNTKSPSYRLLFDYFCFDPLEMESVYTNIFLG